MNIPTYFDFGLTVLWLTMGKVSNKAQTQIYLFLLSEKPKPFFN